MTEAFLHWIKQKLGLTFEPRYLWEDQDENED